MKLKRLGNAQIKLLSSRGMCTFLIRTTPPLHGMPSIRGVVKLPKEEEESQKRSID